MMSGDYAAVSEALHRYNPPVAITQRLTVSLSNHPSALPPPDSLHTVAEASSCGYRFLRCLFLPGPHPHPLPCPGKRGFLKPEWGAKPHSFLGVSGPESPRRLNGETGRAGSAAWVVPRPPGTTNPFPFTVPHSGWGMGSRDQRGSPETL